MRSPRRTLLPLRAPLAVMAVAGWLAAPQRLYAQAAQEPDLLPLAQAFTAAWNAHDLGAVLAFFAPDAVVRERRGDVPPDVWDTHDPQVVRKYLHDSHDGAGDLYDPGGLVWASGPQAIAVWAAERFAANHRAAAGRYRAAGGAVGWRYQQFSDPSQRVPGVGPLEGTAEAVVRGGRITLLTLVLSPASVARQWSEVASYTGQVLATRRPSPFAPFESASSVQPRGLLHDGPAAPEPTTLAWPLALDGLALLASITAGRRRRRVS